MSETVSCVKKRSQSYSCLLYTSDAADDLLCVDLGGRRIMRRVRRSLSLVNPKVEFCDSPRYSRSPQLLGIVVVVVVFTLKVVPTSAQYSVLGI